MDSIDEISDEIYTQSLLGYKLINRLLTLQCQDHKDEFCDKIHLKATSKSPRVCFLCIHERNIPTSEVTTVRQVLNASSDSFVANYPLLEDTQISKKVKNIVGSMDTLITQFETFYSQLQSTISQVIESFKSKQKERLLLLSSAYSEALEVYKDAGRIKEFQENLLLSLLDSEEPLKQFLQTQSERSSINSVIINKQLDDFENLKNKFLTQKTQEIAAFFVNLADKIECFAEQDLNSIVSSLLNLQPQTQEGPSIYEENDNGISCANKISQNQQEIQVALDNKKKETLELQEIQDSFNQLNSFQKSNQVSILSKIAISPSLNYIESGKQMSITKTINGLIVIEPDNKNEECWNQCYMSQPLSYNKKYQILLEFNNEQNVPPQFCVGLIEACNKDNRALHLSQLHYYEKNGDNISKVLCGRKVHSGEGHKRIGNKQLELRICLKEKLLRISNYPSHENVSELDCPERIKSNETYHLGFSIACKQNTITIVDFLVVKNFDDNM